MPCNKCGDPGVKCGTCNTCCTKPVRYTGADIDCVGIEDGDSLETVITKLSGFICDLPFEDGDNGATAYELAVSEGFVGTEAEWLSSLVGEAGSDGVGVESITSGDGNIIFTMTDGTVTNIPLPDCTCIGSYETVFYNTATHAVGEDGDTVFGPLASHGGGYTVPVSGGGTFEVMYNSTVFLEAPGSLEASVFIDGVVHDANTNMTLREEAGSSTKRYNLTVFVSEITASAGQVINIYTNSDNHSFLYTEKSAFKITKIG